MVFWRDSPPVGHGLLIHEVSRSHKTTRHRRQDSSGRVISSSQRPLPDNTHNTHNTNIHAPGGIRTHNLSRRAATGTGSCHHSRQDSSGLVISSSQRLLPDNTHNTHNRQTSMPPVGFEPTISAGERPQTYALDRAATGTGRCAGWNTKLILLSL